MGLKWNKSHQEKVSETSKEWFKNHPDYMRNYMRNYWKIHPELHKKFKAKRRGLGFILLNEPFDGAERHHIDFEIVVYIPKELHRSVPHSVLRNENMTEINDKAFEWLIKRGVVC